MQERKENFMIKVFKSIMAAFLVAVMVASCSNGSSGGDSSDENSVAGTVNDNNSLAGTVWALGSATGQTHVKTLSDKITESVKF